MPTVKITASQVVYYEKMLDLPQDEYDELMSLQDEDGLMVDKIAQWLADGDSGFSDEDVVETESLEGLDIKIIHS